MNSLKKLTFSAMFLALCMALPFLTGQIKEIGNMLLPMHLPVMLCGIICGWQYGAAVGLAAPLFRSLCFSMPQMPGALSMAFELAAYGLVIGVVFSLFKKKSLLAIYVSMLSAMLLGRAVWGLSQAVIFSVLGNPFTFQMFFAASVINAVPGIVLQLILMPSVIAALDRFKVIRLNSQPTEIRRVNENVR